MQANCLCGALTARIAEDAEAMTIACHCRECQKRSGAPFGVTAYFPADSVTISGTAQSFTRPTDSGNLYTTGFCPTCGSTIWGRASRMPELVGVPVGAFADPDFAPPVRSVHEQSRHAWITMPDTMARHPRGRDS